MSQLSDNDLNSLAERLRDWSGEVTADNVATVLSSAVTTTAEIPGDPDGIEDLGVACGRVADGLDSAADSLSPVVGKVEGAWQGEAAESAVKRINTARKDTETEAETLRTTARILTTLADATRSAHERHGDVHGRLSDLARRAPALTDETEAAELADQAAAALRDAADVYSTLHQDTADATKSLGTVLYGGTALSELVGETPEGRRSLEEILRQYQVAGSASPQVKFPPPDLADIINPILKKLGKDIPSTNWNAEELELFRQLRPDEMYTWYRVQQEAYNVSQGHFPDLEHTTHSHTDAFRHAYWNARMTQEFGEEWAEAFATAHERRPTNDMQSEAMDLHNNELGRRIAVENPGASPEELAQLVGQAVDRGDTIVLDGQGRISYSDQVGHNQTVVPKEHDESVIDHDGALDTNFEGVRPKGGYPW